LFLLACLLAGYLETVSTNFDEILEWWNISVYKPLDPDAYPDRDPDPGIFNGILITAE